MSKTFRQSWADERRVRLTKGYSRIAPLLAAADAKLRQQREMRQHAADRKPAACCWSAHAQHSGVLQPPTTTVGNCPATATALPRASATTYCGDKTMAKADACLCMELSG